MTMKFIIQPAFAVLLAFSFHACSRNERPLPATVFERYIEAANLHDIEAVRAITAEDVVWNLGRDTLIGVEETLRPLAFDEGAHTVLTASSYSVNGDTINFNLVEHNDVLDALGVRELHHSGQMVVRNGLIIRIAPLRPPLERKALADSVITFWRWLREHRPEVFDRMWHNGKFNYTRNAGVEMPNLIYEWKRSRR
jgi:hypothetical protein